MLKHNWTLKLWVLLYFISIPYELMAKSVTKQYKVAVELVENENYHQAKEHFQNLHTNLKTDHPLYPFCTFYYAFSLLKEGRKLEAKKLFLELTQDHPTWKYKSEVLYWLAKIDFEQEKYLQAYEWVSLIRDKKYQTSTDYLIQFYLQKASYKSLKELLKTYNTDESLAEKIIEELQEHEYDTIDKEILDILENNFEYKHDDFKASTEVREVNKKKHYNIAILLPFLLNQFTNTDFHEVHAIKNTFLIELYEGMYFASLFLNTPDHRLSLHAYDTKAKKEVAEEILETQAFQAMDLIIGPLSESEVMLAKDFSKKNHINMFNPLSKNYTITQNNYFSFLCTANEITRAKKAGEITLAHVKKKVNEDKILKVGIIYDDLPIHEMKAKMYAEHLENSQDINHIKITLHTQIIQEQAHDFLAIYKNNFLKETQIQSENKAELPEEELVDLDLNDLDIIYVISNNELIVNSILSAIALSSSSPMIIGEETWLTFSNIALSFLTKFNIYLLAPEYINYEATNVKQFIASFYKHFHIYPTYYHFKGYEIMHFLGNMLIKYGVLPQKYWAKDHETYSGKVFTSGFYYGNHQDNQNIPILTIQNRHFRITR